MDLGELETRKANAGRRRFNVYRVVLPGLPAVDYERIERFGISVSSPFTDCQIVTPSRSDEVTSTTERSDICDAPRAREEIEPSENHHLTSSLDDETVDEAEVEYVDEDGALDELLVDLGCTPSQRAEFAAAYLESAGGFARLVGDARHRGKRPVALLTASVRARAHLADPPRRGLTPEEIERMEL